jgi:predicted O-methyltransferase YrrM
VFSDKLRKALSGIPFLGKFLRAVIARRSRAQLPRGSAVIDNSFFDANSNSDISDHLSLIYSLCIAKRPNSILELGTRGGESTRVFAKYCEDQGKIGFSIDLEEAPNWLRGRNWKHFQSDDISLGLEVNRKSIWPDKSAFQKFDFIFLDSSHEYLHTLQELEIYWHWLERGGIFAFHDTNLSEKVTRKLSGEINIGWDNENGVSRAIEQFFNVKLSWDELKTVGKNSGSTNIFSNLIHFPWNNGLTIIIKA